MPYSTLDDLSPTRKLLLGLAIAGVGLATAWLLHVRPEGLHVPSWVAYAACACFVIVGVAVALHSAISRRVYAWTMVGLLAVMASIPGWIAFGPGDRQCTSSIPLLAGEFGCRIAFGVGAFIMIGIVVSAVVVARKGTNAD